VVVIVGVVVMLFESNPLDTFGASSGNGSVHSLSKGQNWGVLYRCRWFIEDVNDYNSSIKKGGIKSQLD
jgi:hypothetical protein